MRTRTGRRIAIVTVVAVIAIAATLVWLGRDHIRFFLAFESVGPNAQGYAEFRHRQTGIVFVARCFRHQVLLRGGSSKEPWSVTCSETSNWVTLGDSSHHDR